MIPINKDVLFAILEHGYVYMRTPKGSRKVTLDDLVMDKNIAERIQQIMGSKILET